MQAVVQCRSMRARHKPHLHSMAQHQPLQALQVPVLEQLQGLGQGQPVAFSAQQPAHWWREPSLGRKCSALKCPRTSHSETTGTSSIMLTSNRLEL